MKIFNLATLFFVVGGASAFLQPKSKAAGKLSQLEAWGSPGSDRGWNGVQSGYRNRGFSDYGRDGGHRSRYQSMDNDYYGGGGGYGSRGYEGGYGRGYGGGYGSSYGRGRDYGGSRYGGYGGGREYGNRNGYGYTNQGSAYIDGRSSRTLMAPHGSEASNVFLTSEGRPIDCELEFYSGPNSPARVKVYSEDGYRLPFQMSIATPGYSDDKSVNIRNTGSSLPVQASVQPSPHPLSTGGGGYGDTIEIQGKSLKTWSMNPETRSAHITIETYGMPIMCSVEVWGVSDHVSQSIEIYNEDGQIRPVELTLELPDDAATVAIRNKGSTSFPMIATVEAAHGSQNGYYSRGAYDGRGMYY